jgi:N-acetylglutamate synthase-like GNAT family acetyltransferase
LTKTTVNARKATMRDVPCILAVINQYAVAGVMLPRTEFENAGEYSRFFGLSR